MLKKLVTVLAAVICTTGFSFAATQSSSSSTDSDLTSLEAQINALNQQLNSLEPNNLLRSNSRLSEIGNFYQKRRGGGLRGLHSDDSLGFFIDSLPTITYELALLQELQAHPVNGVAIGGYFEQDVQYWNGDSITTPDGVHYQRGSDAYLTTMNLDVLAQLNDWSMVLVRPEVANLGTSTESMSIHDAFITLGNLSKTPLYATLGKTYVPFGAFTGSAPWANSLTKSVFEPPAKSQIIFGYYQQGLNSSISVFQTDYSRRNINNFAYRLFYSTSRGAWNYGAGASYLNDTRGLGSAFIPEGPFDNSENSRNALYDLNATVGYKIWTLNAEWLTLQRSVFTTAGLNQGKPQAWDVDGSVSPLVRGKTLTMLMGYSHTSHLQGLPMQLGGLASPGDTASAGFNSQWLAAIIRPITPHYSLGFEGAYDTLYNGQNTYEFTVDNSIYF